MLYHLLAFPLTLKEREISLQTGTDPRVTEVSRHFFQTFTTTHPCFFREGEPTEHLITVPRASLPGWPMAGSDRDCQGRGLEGTKGQEGSHMCPASPPLSPPVQISDLNWESLKLSQYHNGLALDLPAKKDSPGAHTNQWVNKDFEGWGSQGCSSWDEERTNHYF